MSRRTLLVIVALVLALVMVVPAFAAPGEGRGGGVIYVTGQDKYYDTMVTVDPLPPEGPFQKLEMGPNGPQTEYGPGDPGYVGGRWWMDSNGNNVMDEGDHYFLCPLLGPGRDTP